MDARSGVDTTFRRLKAEERKYHLVSATQRCRYINNYNMTYLAFNTTVYRCQLTGSGRGDQNVEILHDIGCPVLLSQLRGH